MGGRTDTLPGKHTFPVACILPLAVKSIALEKPRGNWLGADWNKTLSASIHLVNTCACHVSHFTHINEACSAHLPRVL